jgi:hypothetical protein
VFFPLDAKAIQLREHTSPLKGLKEVLKDHFRAENGLVEKPTFESPNPLYIAMQRGN